jgi:membrane protein DedA with SNARE-associated domain
MLETTIANLGGLSYTGIWIISFLSNMVIPVPEEVVLLTLGYFSGAAGMPIGVVMLITISALLLNDVLIYWLSYTGSTFTTFLYEKFFKRRISKRGDSWIEHHIGNVVIISRFLMQLRFIGPFMAGQRKLSLRRFVAYDMLALVIYVPLYLLLGRYFHHRVEMIIADIGVIKNIILIVVGLILVYVSGVFASRALFKRKAQRND